MVWPRCSWSVRRCSTRNPPCGRAWDGGLRVGSIPRFSSRTRADANPPYEAKREVRTNLRHTRDAGCNSFGKSTRRPLFLQLLADLDFGAPEVDARSTVDRPLADHLGEQEVGKPLDLVRR